MLQRSKLSRYVVIGIVGAGGVQGTMGITSADDPPALGMKVGNIYPDFRLPTLEGDPVNLSDFRGRKVLLIHFASW